MSGRRDLARAMGRCEAGLRDTATVTGPELHGCVDLLRQAVERLLPLLVRVPLTAGHAPVHAAADTGALVLIASGLAELPRLELLARLVAERALLPVLLAFDSGDRAVPEPDDELRRLAAELLGRPGDFVPPATPAQEMLFGRHRRRVPRWFDLDRPVLRGAEPPPRLSGLARAGLAPMFLAAVPEILSEAAAELRRRIGESCEAMARHGAEPPQVLVVCQGEVSATAAAVAAELPRPRLGVLALRWLRPLPADLPARLAEAGAVLVLERSDAPLAGSGPLLREVRAALLEIKERQRPRLHHAVFGLGGEPLNAADLQAFCREIASKDGRRQVYLGVDFAPAHHPFPKRQVLLEALRRAHPGIERLGAGSAGWQQAGTAVEPAHRRLPPRQDPTHDSPTRFWDVVGAELAGGAPLSPDPYLVAGSVPAGTSWFHAVAGDELPGWEPSLCTGCGRCWTACPEGAVLPAVLTPQALLEAGMQRAARQGAAVDALRMLARKLAARLPAAVQEGAARTAGDAVRAAAGPLLDKLDEARAEPLRAACAAVAGSLDPVALAVTEPFFGAAESEKPGSGELLVLAIDPDACKGCGLCVAECEPEALLAGPRRQETVAAAAAGAGLWQDLPDTSGATIARIRELPEPGPAATFSLSRHCLHALAPGDLAEPGSGGRNALRQVLAAAEAHLQPRLQQFLDKLAGLQQTFAERIRESLASALPTSDLDALAEGLAAVDRGRVELAALAASLQERTDSGTVDSARLTRLVETARALADLRWRVEQGSTGAGRARAGVALAAEPATAFAAGFPWNPFSVPVSLWNGPEAGAAALGLLEGQIEAVGADFALVRRARALLEGGRPGPARLGVAEWTEEERGLRPPLLLVCGPHGARQGLAAASAARRCGLPIKVLVLADLDLRAPDADLGLLALAHEDAFVLQSSVGCPDHLFEGARRALAHPGPALLHVHAPSPSRDGFAPDETLEQARLAIRTGALVPFCYDPTAPGVFGLRLQLAAGELRDGRTAAHWAATEARYGDWFEPLAKDAPSPAPLAEYLALPAAERQGRTPFIDCDGQRLAVVADAVAAAEERARVRAVLEEWAGVSSPFTERLREQAAAAVAEQHRQELQRLQDGHRQELEALRAQVEHEMVARLQRKLAALAGGRR